jgi:pyrrolidone-carboxylate peptidase
MGWAKSWDYGHDSNRHLTVLLTAFNPFLDPETDPAGRCAGDLNDEEIDVVQPWGTVTAKIVGKAQTSISLVDKNPIALFGSGQDFLRTPAAHGTKSQQAAMQIIALMENHHPDIVIALGIAEDERGFKIEKNAHNRILAAAADNGARAGYVAPRGTPFVRENDAYGHPFQAYLHDGTHKIQFDESFPIEQIKTSIERRHVPCRVSEDVGVNDPIMWEVLDQLRTPRDGVHILRGGFMHMPAVPGPYNYVQETMNQCVYSAIEATVMSVKPDEYRPHDGSYRAEHRASLYEP